MRRILRTAFTIPECRFIATKRYVSNETIDKSDVAHHSKLSKIWWDVNGEIKPLHSLNPLRIQFVRDGLANVGHVEINHDTPLDGLKILDVGCGGGILSEPLSRIGANVTGIDASEKLIELAKEHATLDRSLSERLGYQATTIEEHAIAYPNKYDAVVASEILEHVSNQELFLKSCVGVLKPGGSLFITTFNQTLLSLVGAIFVAEYLLRLVPMGTHEWKKFMPPTKTRSLLEKHGCHTKLIHGFVYNPLNNQWSWMKSTAVSYALHVIKNPESVAES